MKKILAVLLTLVIVFSFASCNSKVNDDTPNEPGQTTETNDTNREENDKTPEKEPAVLSRGEINGNVYTSEYLGVTFTKPDDWVYASDKEIADILKLGSEFVKEQYQDNFEEALNETGSLYDMMVASSDSSSNMIVSFENLEKNSATSMTEKQYAAIVKTQMSQIATYEITAGDTYEKELVGKKYVAMDVTSNIYGATIYQRYFITKIDKYMISFIITAPTQSDLAKVEKMFS